MWRKLCGSVLAAAVLVTSGSDSGSGTRVQALTLAPSVWNAPWVVQIKLTSLTDGRRKWCTGIALTRHWIATAGHCLAGRSNATHSVEIIRTLINPGRTTQLVVTRSEYNGTASYYNHPDYLDFFGVLDRGNDFGVIKLHGAGMATVTPAYIYDGYYLDIGYAGPLTFHGFGAGSAPTGTASCDTAVANAYAEVPGSIGVLRSAPFLTQFLVGNYGTGFVYQLPLAIRAEIEASTPCDGDSGGPYGIPSTAGSLVLALASGPGNWQHPFTSDGYATMVRPKLDWVMATSRAKGLPITCPVMEVGGHVVRRCQ